MIMKASAAISDQVCSHTPMIYRRLYLRLDETSS
jgi:hypothetical protein